MGSALVGGILASGFATPNDIAITEPNKKQREVLSERYPGVVVANEPVRADAAVLAMKPADVKEACRAITPGSFHRVLSIVAGVRLSSLERWLWKDTAVIRAMPNTPCLVGAGMSAISAGHAASIEDLDWAERVLSSVGLVVRLPEDLLDAATGLSGSGPAYVFYVVEALIAAGVAAGLHEDVATLLTNQMLLGSALLLRETKEPARDLRAAVTSPGGTTEAGIAALEEAMVKEAVKEAVLRSASRSRTLGEQA
jgi:pyrroline-5-carboxylate reductase